MLCLDDTRARQGQREEGDPQRTNAAESARSRGRATKQQRDAYMTALTNAFESDLTQLRQVSSPQKNEMSKTGVYACIT